MMIKIKKKECKGCNTEQYIFSHGLCKRCASIASFKSRQLTISAPRYKTPIRKRKPPYEANRTERWLKVHWGFNSQVELFDYLWDNRPLTCPFTGENLLPYKDDMLMRRICCAHVLPKGTATFYKLNPDNVLLVHPEFHRIVDQGTFKDRGDHPSWDFKSWDLMVEMKREEYEKFKKEYLL